MKDGIITIRPDQWSGEHWVMSFNLNDICKGCGVKSKLVMTSPQFPNDINIPTPQVKKIFKLIKKYTSEEEQAEVLEFIKAAGNDKALKAWYYV